MQSCLGIYVQENLIKYAKVCKERNKLKVEAYGVKFYDTDVEKAIDQIVKETYSFQIPISVNIDKEKYTYSNVFSLLKPQDLEKAIDTEFEFFCNNNNQNRNALEFRKLRADNLEDRDKIRVIYTYIDKARIAERKLLLDRYKADNMYPVATIIPNLNRVAIQEENCVIVNIEQTTDITTIINGKIYQIDKIETGMKKILEDIAVRENSVQRAYEICKNTTVYTKSGQNLKVDGNEYLEEIIIVLSDIIEKIKETIENSVIDIKNIYITGMGLIINNIDLLFQESFIDKKCEILVPYFVEKTNVKINIKDYIEVNSAISLAIQGLEQKKGETNFSDKGKAFENIVKLLKTDVRSVKPNSKRKTKLTFKEAINSELDVIEQTLLRIATALMLVAILYVGTVHVLTNSIKEKTSEVDKVIEESKTKIAELTRNTSLINARTDEYQKLVDTIDQANSQVSESYLSKNAIPNLLNKIMYNIPTGVQLISIENQSNKDITITAQAEKYDQLGYFKAVLEEEGILTNITTTKGVKQGNLISITITGQLPY